jgi:hypothetical protein
MSGCRQTSSFTEDEGLTWVYFCARMMGSCMERYLQSGVFDPETVCILNEALTDAWRSLQATGVYFTSQGQAEATQEKLATRIIEMAERGERDPHRLRAGALEHLAQSNLGRWRSRSTGL